MVRILGEERLEDHRKGSLGKRHVEMGATWLSLCRGGTEQVGRISCPMDVSQLLLSATQYLDIGPMSDHCSRDGDYKWA